jgi:hypothetical protein
MFSLVSIVLSALCSGLKSRRQLMLENLALRHQLTVLKRSVPKPKLSNSDRLLWVLLQRCWSDWQRVLVIIQPRTVLGWHRLGFRLFWRWKSRIRTGRPCLDPQLVTLIGQMWLANPVWSKKSCGFTAVEFEQPAQALGFADRAMLLAQPFIRKRNEIFETLVVSFPVMMGQVFLECIGQRPLPKEN